ncbi:MAG: hypothetical protein HYX60_11010 [Legionella longbeachae]|nr:hypothetical protein [Legionella longbeachae]
MAFSSKLIADYVELINGELDKIPVKLINEFDLIADELQNFIKSKSLFSNLIELLNSTVEKKSLLSEAAQEQLAYVRYLLNTPKDYVKSPKDYAEYQEILKNRIQAKIIEFRTFTNLEKEAYLKFQQERNPSAYSKLHY